MLHFIEKLFPISICLVACGSTPTSSSNPDAGTVAPTNKLPTQSATGGASTGGAGTGGASTGGTSTGGASTGGVGGAGTGGASTGGLQNAGGAPNICIQPGDDCSNNINGCCNGSICIHLADSPDNEGICSATCLQNSDCVSGCCTKLGNAAEATCSPSSECCVNGNACVSNTDCCGNAICAYNPTTGASYCAALCAQNTDCISGCCAPISNSAEMICSDPSWCP